MSEKVANKRVYMVEGPNGAQFIEASSQAAALMAVARGVYSVRTAKAADVLRAQQQRGGEDAKEAV